MDEAFTLAQDALTFDPDIRLFTTCHDQMSIEVNNYIISFPNVDLSEYATFPTQPTDAVYELIEQSKSGNSIYCGISAYDADKSSEKHPAENLVTAT